MSKEIIINSTVNETRVAILENGSVSEIYIERHKKKGVAGNIYKGKIVKVLPGMQSAFVDIGLDKAAFLHVADLTTENINEDMLVQSIDEEQNDKEQEDEFNGKQHVPIEDMIQEGQEIIVQVAKEPIGQKGARLTTHLTIPGRYLVLMPYYNHIGVSRKIENEEERERLKGILTEIKPENFGLIARTVSEGSTKEDLESDLDYLLRIWNKLSEKMDSANAPQLIYKDLELLYRTLRDITTNDISKIIIDNRSDFLKLKTFQREYFPNLDIEIKLYENSIPIFDYYNIEIEINRMFDRVVWLKSGGYIVIDQAEALTVIDVNTGKYVGKRNFEETILKTNLEAAKEIAYQLKLRNIGGIIIVDFIDMEKDEHIEKVLQTLNQEFKKDRGKVTVVNISPLGLFEITRKRVKESITKALSENCPYCEGRGFIKSKVTVCYDILREIRRIAPFYEKKKIFVEAHSSVVDYMLNDEKECLDEIELMYNINIEVKANNNFHIEYYEVIPLEKF